MRNLGKSTRRKEKKRVTDRDFLVDACRTRVVFSRTTSAVNRYRRHRRFPRGGCANRESALRRRSRLLGSRPCSRMKYEKCETFFLGFYFFSSPFFVYFTDFAAVADAPVRIYLRYSRYRAASDVGWILGLSGLMTSLREFAVSFGLLGYSSCSPVIISYSGRLVFRAAKISAIPSRNPSDAFAREYFGRCAKMFVAVSNFDKFRILSK